MESMMIMKTLFLGVLFGFLPCTLSIGQPQVVFSWNKVGVKWPNATMRRQHSGKTVNVIGIKVTIKSY